jgi:dienelactone hydrolase
MAVAVVALTATKLVLDANYFKGYDPAAPLEAAVVGIEERPDPEVAAQEQAPAYKRVEFFYNGFRNGRVPALMAMPVEATDPLPCVVFLHGIGQSKGFLDEICIPFVKGGFAIVTYDQLMCGERKHRGAPPLQQANEFRQRPAYTVMDTRRLIDYLQTREDIDPERIYLAGASYGAITGTTVAAMDRRIKAVVLCYGGGNIPKMLEARMVAQEIGGWMPLAKTLVWYLMSPADPLNYAEKIWPTPVFLQNGTDDCLIASEAAKALQEAVREPKKIKIYQGDHIGFDIATVRLVLSDIVAWLQEQDTVLTGKTTATAKAAA